MYSLLNINLSINKSKILYINFFLYDLNIQKKIKINYFSLNNLNLTNENYILK